MSLYDNPAAEDSRELIISFIVSAAATLTGNKHIFSPQIRIKHTPKNLYQQGGFIAG